MQAHPKMEKDRAGSESNYHIRLGNISHLSSDKVSNHPSPRSVGLQRVLILSDRYKLHVIKNSCATSGIHPPIDFNVHYSRSIEMIFIEEILPVCAQSRRLRAECS